MVFRSQKAHQSIPGVVPLLLIKNRRSIPAAETGRDFGLRRLRNLNSKISPKGRKQELQNSTILFHQQPECGIFLLKRQGKLSHLPAFNAWRPLLPPVPAPVPAPENPCLQRFGWIEKTRWSRWREATRFIQRLFSNHQLLGSFRAQGEWLLSKGVFAKVESQLFNSFYWNQHFLTEILKGSTSLDLHYLMRVVASDIGARSLMLDLETSALELGGSSFKAPEKCSFPCHVEAWEHFAAIYNPSVSSFQDWHTTKKKQKKLKYILWVLLESWHFRKELVLKAKWKAKQRAHSPWLQILHALEMKGSASYYFHIFNFKSFWPKKIQVTKEAVPSFTS